LNLADLQKTYENLTMNLGKILRSFENRAPELHNVHSVIRLATSVTRTCSTATTNTRPHKQDL